MYQISKGQLITIWVFGILFLLGDLISIANAYSPSGFSLSLLLFVPGALIFYSIGWKNQNGKILVKPRKYSNGQPTWTVTLMYLITLRIYTFFWVYKNLRFFKKINQTKATPWLRLIGLFIPILNLFIIYYFIKDVKIYAEKIGIKSRIEPGTSLAVFVVLNLLMLGFIELSSIQKTLNEIWAKEQPSLPTRKNLNWGEVAYISAFVILIFIGILQDSGTM